MDPSGCWQYSRTAGAPRKGCELGPREQMNGATSFLDGSAIYGNSEEVANRLRTFDGGHLRTGTGDLLPANIECDPSTLNSTSRYGFFIIIS